MPTIVEQAELAVKEKHIKDELSKIEPGGKYLMKIELKEPISQEILDSFYTNLLKAGVEPLSDMIMSVSGKKATISFKFKVPEGRIASITLLLAIPAVIISLMLAFGVVKIEEAVARAIIPLALIAGATVILYGLATRREYAR